MRTISKLALGALAVIATAMTASCQKEIDPAKKEASFTVNFTMAEQATKTAIAVDGEAITITWDEADKDRITFFEGENAGTVSAINLDESKKHATFTAAFAGAAPATAFKYSALVAGSQTAAHLPAVPATQHPSATSYDPDADILVGQSGPYTSRPSDPVSLVYERAVALSRVSFSGIPDGAEIYGAQIIANQPIAGTAKSVDYAAKSVDFSTADATTIDVIYDDKLTAADGTFTVYFVTVPTTSTETTIKLVTDQGTFIKTSTKSLSFSPESFKDIKLNYSGVSPVFYKASTAEDGYKYLIVNGTHSVKNAGSTGEKVGDQTVTVSDNTITIADPSKLLWEVDEVEEPSTGARFTLKNGEYYLYKSSSDLKQTSSSSSASDFDYYGGYFKCSSNVVYYYSSSSKWYLGSSEKDERKVDFFTSRLPSSTSVSFSSKTAKYDMGTSSYIIGLPTLNNTSGTVSYSSSDDDIADIDNNGVITFKKIGTVTITATITLASNKLYQAASASDSFELTVENSNTPKYYKASVVEDGQAYIIVYDDNAIKNAGANGKVGNQEVSVTNNYISLESAADLLWTVTMSGSPAENARFSLANGGYNMYINKSSSTYYLYQNKSENSNNLFDYDGSYFTGKYGSTIYYFYRSSSSWKGSTSSYTVDFYTSKLPRNFAFVKNSVEKQSTDSKFTNPLTETFVGVEYKSSNTNVATVDSSTGEITIVADGSTTITASISSDATYQPAEASYTLTVGKLYTYEKVDELTSGATYIIVNRDNNMAMSATTSKAKQAVAPESNKIVSNALAGYEFIISATESAYTFQSVSSGKYILYDSSDPYYEFSDSKTEYILESGPKDSAEADTQFFYFYYKKSSTYYYLYYDFSSSRQYFLFGNSGSKTGTKDDGSVDRLSGGINLYKKVVAE